MVRPAATARMGPLVGNGDNNLGAAAYGTVNGFDEAWITGIVTGDDDHVQRPGPRRRPVENEERATDRISDESKRDPGSVPGATRAGDQYGRCGGRRPANREITPSPTADAVARICAPPMATDRSSPSESAS